MSLEVIRVADTARFSKFVTEGEASQCWEWQSTRNNRGYGKFWLNGRSDLAHRASYKIHTGPIPTGLQVRHTCDNPPCVNPAHLILGTGLENARDAVERGRYCRGVDNVRAKLTPEQVHEIKKCWSQGETQVSLARRHGISRSAIQWVLNGRNWAWLGEAS